MKVVDIADEIYRELGSPTSLSIPPIAYWVRANIGKVNSAINHSYYVDPTTLEILEENPPGTFTELGEDEKTILKMLYFLHHIDLQIRQQVLTFNTRRALEITTNGHTVRLVSPTEVGKYFASLRKAYSDDLTQWTNWYRIARATPRQVTGDDTVSGPDYPARPIYTRYTDL